MRIVRGRDDARWLPSRYNAALFRLLAWMRLRATPPAASASVLVVDRHQSAAETYVTGVWILLTSSCFLAAGVFDALLPPFAFALAIPLTVVLMHVILAIGALLIAPPLRALGLLRRQDDVALNSTLIMLLLIAIALHFMRIQSWVRYVAFQFLALLLLNGIAAVIVLALRGSIQRAERAVGGESSAP